ncbi:uncharacterized protein LOC110034636 [Phalaenopsis equestris]|uniref:uncharacterized protein LOC110034636 n=1 Tax=Phalaenopsis equestris TaxID=78828 RepID=UPI0009E461A7|nr:uncharacterized protein LOC110034636 [Phalaenopsis equestris]
MDGCRTTRKSLKTHRSNWKEKLRQNCLKRVGEERGLLLWEIRSKGRHASNQKEVVDSTFWHIVSDELKKIKASPLGEHHGISNSKNDDILWEYDHLCFEIESEDLMMEMERILYEDIREEKIRRELELIEEEDEYLARAVFEHMQINDDQSLKSKIWCPICKRGELKETHHLIHCTDCMLQLDLENDKVNLEFLRARLAEVHMEHLDRGCRALPEFCMETRFDLTALYIRCIACGTFEIVL